MISRSVWRRVLGHALLAAQRRNARPSWPVSQVVRRAVVSSGLGAAKVDELVQWSAPLTSLGATGQLADLQADALAYPTEEIHRGRRIRLGGAEEPTVRCLLATASLDVGGGLDEVVGFLARRLPKHGLKTAVLNAVEVEGGASRFGAMLERTGVDVVEMDASIGRRWIKDWLPDVISAHGAPAWVQEAALQFQVPFVETLHGMHSFFGTDWKAEGRRSNGIASIVAVSDLVRRQYIAGNPTFSQEQIVTIPNAVDTDRRIAVERTEARRRLGLHDEHLSVSLARYCLQKNTYGLVASFESVLRSNPHAHLLVAGFPEDRLYLAQVQRLLEVMPNGERVHLRGHAPYPALLLSAADAFVLDSFFEGWALASMEALYAGIPVVISEVGGAWEQVGEDGSRGVVVSNPLRNPLDMDWTRMREARYRVQSNQRELASAIDGVMGQREQWLERRPHLVEESAERFEPERCARAHAEVLISAARKRT